MKLVKIHKISGTIELLSGLHIGAGKDNVEIGGLDQPIIKDPLTGAPYIPGSSLKGKMRSLLEVAVFMGQSEDSRKHIASEKPCACGKRGCPICSLFGAHTSADKCDADLGPTRLLVRDCRLTDDFMTLHKDGQLPMEIKNENTINRVTGVAENPRPLERVPAGVCFAMELIVKEFEGDDSSLIDWLGKGLTLVSHDALGGNGSRGSGQVRFTNMQRNGENWTLPEHVL